MVTEDRLSRYEFKGYGQFFGQVAVHEKVRLTKIAADIEGTKTK